MAFDYGPYNFDTLVDAQSSPFTFTHGDGIAAPLPATPTGRMWSWESDDTSSSNVGPTSGQGGSPDGYLYTESSNPAQLSDEFIMEFNTVMDARTNSIVVLFYWNQRGDDNISDIYLETQETVGGPWVIRGTFGGGDIPSGGVDVWNQATTNLDGVVSDEVTKLRIRIVMPNSGQLFHNDVGIDSVHIVGTDIDLGAKFFPAVAVVTPTGYAPTGDYVPMAPPAGPITMEGTGTSVASISSPTTINMPYGMADGDIAILQIALDITGTASTPSGWNLLHEQAADPDFGTASGTPTQVIFWTRISGATADPSVTWSGDHIQGIVSLWRGAKETGTPFFDNIASAQKTSIAEYLRYPPAYVPNDGFAILHLGAIGDDLSYVSVNSTGTIAPTHAYLHSTTVGNDSSLDLNYVLPGSSYFTGVVEVEVTSYWDAVLTTVVMIPQKHADYLPSEGISIPYIAWDDWNERTVPPAVLATADPRPTPKIGDTLILHIVTQGNETPALTGASISNWTFLGDVSHVAGSISSDSTRSSLYYRVADGTTADTVVMDAPIYHIVAGISCVRGAHAMQPPKFHTGTTAVYVQHDTVPWLGCLELSYIAHGNGYEPLVTQRGFTNSAVTPHTFGSEFQDASISVGGGYAFAKAGIYINDNSGVGSFLELDGSTRVTSGRIAVASIMFQSSPPPPPDAMPESADVRITSDRPTFVTFDPSPTLTPLNAEEQVTTYEPSFRASPIRSPASASEQITAYEPSWSTTDNWFTTTDHVLVVADTYPPSLPWYYTQVPSNFVGANLNWPVRVGPVVPQIEYVGVGTRASSTSGLLSNPSIPTGTAEDDLMLLHTSSHDNTTETVPVDWTLLHTCVTNHSTLSIYYKFAGVSESSPACKASANTYTCVITSWRNVASVGSLTYFDGFNHSYNVVDGIAYPTFRPPEAGCATVYTGMWVNEANAIPARRNTAHSITEVSNGGYAGGSDLAQCVDYYINAIGGQTTGVTYWDATQDDNDLRQCIASTIVLRPINGTENTNSFTEPEYWCGGDDAVDGAAATPNPIAEDGSLLILQIAVGGPSPAVPGGTAVPTLSPGDAAAWTYIDTVQAEELSGTPWDNVRVTLWWKVKDGLNESISTPAGLSDPNYLWSWSKIHSFRNVDIANGPIDSVAKTDISERIYNGTVGAISGSETFLPKSMVAMFGNSEFANGGNLTWIRPWNINNDSLEYCHSPWEGGQYTNSINAWGIRTTIGTVPDFTVQTEAPVLTGAVFAAIVLTLRPFEVVGEFYGKASTADVVNTQNPPLIPWVAKFPPAGSIGYKSYTPAAEPFFVLYPERVSSNQSQGTNYVEQTNSVGVPYAWSSGIMTHNATGGGLLGSPPYYRHALSAVIPSLDESSGYTEYLARSGHSDIRDETYWWSNNYAGIAYQGHQSGLADYATEGGPGVGKYQAICALHHVDNTAFTEWDWANFVVDENDVLTDVGTPPWYDAAGRNRDWVAYFYGKDVANNEGYLIGLKQSGSHVLPCLYEWSGGVSWDSGTEIAGVGEEPVTFVTELVGWCRADMLNPDRIYVLCTTKNLSDVHLNFKIFAVDVVTKIVTRVTNDGSADYDSGTWNFEGLGDGVADYGRASSSTAPSSPKMHGQGTSRDEERCRPIYIDEDNQSFFFRTKHPTNIQNYTRVWLNAINWMSPLVSTYSANLNLSYPATITNVTGTALLERWVMHGIVWRNSNVNAIMMHVMSARSIHGQEWNQTVVHVTHRDLLNETDVFEPWTVADKQFPAAGETVGISDYYFQYINGGIRNWGQDIDGTEIGFGLKWNIIEVQSGNTVSSDEAALHFKWWVDGYDFVRDVNMDVVIEDDVDIGLMVATTIFLTASVDVDVSIQFSIESSIESGGGYLLEDNTAYHNFAVDCIIADDVQALYADDINVGLFATVDVSVEILFDIIPDTVQVTYVPLEYSFWGAQWHEEFLVLMNDLRASSGLAPYLHPEKAFWEDYPIDIATLHSKNVHDTLVLEHEDPRYPPGEQLLSERAATAGYKNAAENVLMNGAGYYAPPETYPPQPPFEGETYDPFFHTVKSLIHFDSDTVTDVVLGVPWTNNTLIHNTTNARYGQGAAELTATSVTQLNTPIEIDYTLPFTIEFSLYITTIGPDQKGIFNTGAFTNANRFQMGLSTDGYLGLFASTNSTTVLTESTYYGPLNEGQWYEIAVSSDGTNLWTYVDGVVVQTSTWLGQYVSINSMFRLGNYLAANQNKVMDGGIFDEFRISQVDRYKGQSYTVAGPFEENSPPNMTDVLSLIHFDDDVITDVVLGTDWTSVGATQYMPNPRYGTGDISLDGAVGTKVEQFIPLDWNAPWTIECSVWFNTLDAGQGVWLGGDGSDGNRIMVNCTPTGEISLLGWSGGLEDLRITTSAGTVAAGQWYEVAATSDGTTCYLYIDGVVQPQSTTGIDTFSSLSTQFRWGQVRGSGVNRGLDGRLDECRISQLDRYGGVSYATAGPFPSGVVDPLFNDVGSLLHFEGDIITDPVSGDWVYSTAGTGADVAYSTADSRYGAGSMLCTPSGVGTDVGMIYRGGRIDPTRAFTIECSVKPTNLDEVRGIFMEGGLTYQDNDSRFQLDIRSGELKIFASTNTTVNTEFATTGANIVVGQWYDIAVTYDGVDTITVYVNGQALGSGTGFSGYSSKLDILRWGFSRQSPVVRMFHGYIDECRTTYADRYGGNNYTVPGKFPDGPVDKYFSDVLYMQHYEKNITSDVVGTDWLFDAVGANGKCEQSSEQSRYGGRSLKTAGDGDLHYGVLYQPSATLDTSQAFTLECSIYFTTLSTVNGVFGQGVLSSNLNRFQLIVRTDGKLSLFAATGGTKRLSLVTPDALAINTWYDIAVCYDGVGTVYLYVDGDMKISGGTFNLYAPTNDYFRWAIARADNALRTNTGYIDETRITQADRYGGENYTVGRFTPTGAAPPSADPNYADVLSLIHFDDDHVTDEVVLDWDVVGGFSPTVRYGTGIVELDGEIGTKLHQDIALDWSAPWTIECSVWFNSLGVSQGVWLGSDGTDADRIMVNSTPTGELSLFGFDGNEDLRITTAAGIVTVNQWYELAVTSDGTTCYMYLDGNVVGQTTGIDTFNSVSTQFRWGQIRDGGQNVGFDGYMDDCRITERDRYGGAPYTVVGPFPDVNAPGTGGSVPYVVNYDLIGPIPPEGIITPQEAYDLWFSSTGHRGNMLKDWGVGREVYSTMGLVTRVRRSFVEWIDAYHGVTFDSAGYWLVITNVFADVTKTMGTLYLDTYYDLRGATITMMDVNYDLRTYVDVRGEVDIVYSLRVGQSVSIPYGDKLAVELVLPLTYNVRSYTDLSYGKSYYVNNDVEMVYRIAAGNIVANDVVLPYTVIISAEVELPYDLPDRVGAEILLPYGVPYRVSTDVDILYSDGVLVASSIEVPYALATKSYSQVALVYSLTQPVKTELDILYGIQSYNSVASDVSMFYAVVGDAQIESVGANSLVIGGRDVSFEPDIDVSQGEGDVPWVARARISSSAEMSKISIGDPVVLTLRGDEWNLVVTEKTVGRQFASADYVLKMESAVVNLMQPRASESDYTYDAAMSAKDMVEDLLGQTVDWQVLDWIIPAGKIVLTDVTPIAAARVVTDVIMAVILANRDGTLRVQYLYPEPMHRLEFGTVSHTLTDITDNISLRESFEYRSGANYFRLLEGESAFDDVLDWEPDEDDDTRGVLRAYLSPWRLDYVLRYTDSDGPASFVNRGVVQRQETELAEFAEGNAGLRFPVISIDTIEWMSDPLGAISYDETSRTLIAGTGVNGGYGLAEITYTVQAVEYDVTGVLGGAAQFIIEDGD